LSKMFSAQANPWEHCVASGQAGGRGRRSGRVSRQKRRRRQEKAAAAGARALPRRNPPQPRYRNTCTGTHPPTLSPSKGELDRALTPRIARAAARARAARRPCMPCTAAVCERVTLTYTVHPGRWRCMLGAHMPRLPASIVNLWRFSSHRFRVPT
jgi:hypothetical protein